MVGVAGEQLQENSRVKGKVSDVEQVHFALHVDTFIDLFRTKPLR